MTYCVPVLSDKDMTLEFAPTVNAYMSQNVRDRASRIKLACFDVDGTLTDGRLVFDSEGRELKAFHAHDGQGLVLLQRAGVIVALVTARVSPIVQHRAAELGIKQVHLGAKDKLAKVRELAAQLDISLDEVAFMGDDAPDLRAMREVGLSVAPADAHRWTLDAAHWRTTLGAGRGAARELCDLILESQGKVESLLQGIVAADSNVDPRHVAPFSAQEQREEAQ